ncbi:MAG TPA: ABC transporter ATP-binding protein [Bacillota bacterium]|nr:ABC transporter ATP-binding protein [Bacillota bacterium]
MLIEVNRATKIYRSGEGEFKALKGVDLQVKQGEFIAVVGQSGSGKSTLLNLLSGIDRPSSGRVTVGGEALERMSEEALSRWRGRNLGIVFQFFQLLPTLTAAENVMMPMDFCRTYATRERRGKAEQLLERVGVAAHADKLPLSLSGGEQQRVAIARALANDPMLILADEPTGNLDAGTAEDVFGLLQSMAQEGKTVVMVTHNSELARRASRVITIYDGNIIEDTAAEVSTGRG